MKQKFLCLFFILAACVSNPVFAQTVEVKALENFSTANPPKTISIQLLEPVEIKKDKFFGEGVVIEGDLVDVVSPKRLKRDASFAFVPRRYTGVDGKTCKVKAKIKASYTVPVDKKNLAKKTVVTAGNLFVQGFSIGVAAVEGAVKNQEGNRFKSSVSSAYEATPFSYAKKGEDLNVQAGQIFFLKFPSHGKINKEIESVNLESSENSNSDSKKVIEGQNYSYTIEKE